MERTHKFVGTIIDESYFRPYHDLGDLWKICEMCGEPRILIRNGEFTRGKYHDCEKLFVFGALRWEWGQFIFISAGENVKQSTTQRT